MGRRFKIMGARKTKNEMDEIKKKNNSHYAWSWSRYNSSKTNLYLYFLKYVENIQEDLIGNLYSNLGNVLHDCIERIHLGEITREEAIEIYKDAVLELDVMGFTFNRNDEEQNDNIARKYNYSNLHFLENFKLMTGENQEAEAFMECKIGKQLFIGYIDHKMIEDGKTIITDWKSSTIYTGKKISKEAGQLLLYAYSEMQKGVSIEDIKCRWCFSKYCTVSIPLANKSTRQSNMLRCEIGSKLYSSVSMWLKKYKYSEIEIEGYLDSLVMTNDLNVLPKEISSMYEINDCFVYIDITQEAIDELVEDMQAQVVKLIKLENEYSKNKDKMIFYEEVTPETEYFHANLSGYSIKYNLPYKNWLDNKNMFKKDQGYQDEMDELMKELGML
jgi:hypothetical protein